MGELESSRRRSLVSGSCIVLLVLLLAGCATKAVQSGPAGFSGTYKGNEAASVMLPGERVPENFVSVIEDDGVRLTMTQTFRGPEGETAKLVWTGECDGRSRSIDGAQRPMQMSCIRSQAGALINRISGEGWAYTETCVMSTPRRMTCSGAMPDASGVDRNFSYVLDKQN